MKKIRYIFPFLLVVILGLTPLIWFIGKEGMLINGVDTNFPLDPWVWFQRRFFVWNSVTNAGVNFSSSTAGLFFHFIQVVPYSLGFNLQHTQIISFVFWFSLIVTSAFLLARTIIPQKPLIQVLFVTLYSFNIYLFNSWENVKVANLSLVAAIPLALFVYSLHRLEKIHLTETVFLSVIVGIILSGTGINPAYFLSFILVYLLFIAGDLISSFKKDLILKKVKDAAILLSVVTIVNLFWILPTVDYVAREVPSSGSINEIGFINWIDGLSENTSLLNVLRLQGVWDWYATDPGTGVPLYIPYAGSYLFGVPYQLYSFAVTLFAVLSFVFFDARRKSLYIGFGLMVFTGIFLGAGTHPPTGVVFRWLSLHLPFFSLFRSPWYIFTPLVFLAYSGLICLLVNSLDEKLRGTTLRIAKPALFGGVLVMIMATLLYSKPLISGDIFRPARPDGFYINFPAYVFEGKNWLYSGSGRVIGYPNNNIEVFNWGYRGIDSVLGLLVERETLFSPFNEGNAPISIIIKEFFQNLRKGEKEAASSIAGKLNLGLIFEKKDQKDLSDEPSINLDSVPTSVFGDWHFKEFPGSEFVPKIYAAENFYLAYPYSVNEGILSAVGGRDVILNSGDSVVNDLPNISSAGKVILAENSQLQDLLTFEIEPGLLNRILSRDLSTVVFTFEVPSDGLYQPLLERYKLEDFGIDLGKGLDLEVDEKPVVWSVSSLSDSYVRFVPVAFSKGYHKARIKLKNPNLLPGGNFEGEIKFSKSTSVSEGGVYTIESNEKEKFLSILNTGVQNATAGFQISPFDYMGDYYVEVRYKQIYGHSARMLVSQTGSVFSRGQIEIMPNYPEWRGFSFFYRSSRVKSKMEVKLMAATVTDPFGTKVMYDDLKVQKVFSNKLIFVENSGRVITTPRQLDFRKISPSHYEGETYRAEIPHLLVFSENYSPEWELTVYDKEGMELAAPPHFSANFYANAWYLGDYPEGYKFKIYYNPQKLFWAGFIISSLVVTISLTLLIVSKIKKLMGNKQ